MAPEERGPASQAGMRRRNLALVLGTVAEHGPLSRAAVAGRTGLTRAAVSSLVEELRSGGLVDEVGPVERSGRVGRPGTAIAVSARGPAGLGLEVGVGHVGACVVDLRGEVRVWERVTTANRGRKAEAVLRDLAATARRVIAEAEAEGLRAAGAALAVPGVVAAPSDAAGVVERAPNLGWRREPVGELLRDLLAEELPELDVVVENEANLGALAELWAGDGPADFVHVSAEAGIGAALVVGGSLFRGARGFAGELGHVPVRPEGPECSCGARGCLERYAGEAAVLGAAGIDIASAEAGDWIGELAERAGAGEARVRGALEGAGEALGIALAGAVNLVDPAAVVLGGAYAELAEWLLPGVRRELAARVGVRPWPGSALRVSRWGRRGPLLGAGLLTVRRVLADPGA